MTILEKINKAYRENHPNNEIINEKINVQLSNIDVIDKIVNAYIKSEPEFNELVLLKIYGLLQSFFVGIDALYDLAITTTHNKYIININHNDVLRELKFIRNDIVGHPTNRIYADGGYGFSFFDLRNYSKDAFFYHTTINHNHTISKTVNKVDVKKLINNYLIESNILLNNIHNFLTKPINDNSLISEVNCLYQNILSIPIEESLNNLEIIKNNFMQKFLLDEFSKHRFFWRYGLLKTALNWQNEEPEFQEIINFMRQSQSKKINTIIYTMSNQEPLFLKINTPRLLSLFFKFVRTNEETILPIIKQLSHNLVTQDKDIAYLISLAPAKVVKLLVWLKDTEYNEQKQLIIQTLNQYRAKHLTDDENFYAN